MARAPGAIPRRLWPWGAICCLVVGGAAVACQGRGRAAGTEPLPLSVEWAGCATVLRGPVCALPADRRLRLWVATTAGTELTIDGETLNPRAPEVLGGRRFEVEVGEGAREVVVEARRGGVAATFRLPLTDSPKPDWYREARALALANDDQGARRLVEPRAASTSAAERGLALRLLARLDRRQGDREEEERHLRQAIAALEESGLLHEAVEDAIVLANGLLDDWRLTELRSLLSSLSPPEGHAESAYLLDLYTGLVAGKSGDLRGSLRALTAAVSRAERLGLEEKRIEAEGVLALELQRLGRFEDAAALFARLPLAAAPAAVRPCTRAQTLNNHAWALLLAREAGREVEAPSPLLHRALELFDGECRDYPHERVNVRINLALAHFQEGRLGMAESWLDEAHALAAAPLPELMLWAWDLEARLRLAEARPREALALYDEMASRAGDLLSPEAEWRLAYWRAQTLEAMGEVPAALAAYARAEEIVERETLLVPMHEGRDTFLGQRQRATERYLELLLASRLEADALRVARRAQARYLRSLRRFVHLGTLSPPERETWERTVAARQALRAEVDQAAAEAWRLPATELEPASTPRLRTRRAQLAELDALLARLGGDADARADPLALPGAGELLLAYHPLGGDWVGFAADDQGVVALRLAGLEEALAGPSELAARLLAPFATRIEPARAVRVLTSGPLAQVDFHALPFEGAALLASRPVLYGLDLPGSSARALATPTRVLVLADPQGDLPGSRQEARSVIEELRRHRPSWDVRLLSGAAATGTAVRELLPETDLFHYSGHAVFDGWDSFLPLADGGRLTLDDVLASSAAPAWVVLSGCETAASAPLLGVEGLGLAHAFLAAGARTVIAASRPVPDEVAAALMPAFYREWSPGVPPEEALRRAQLALQARDPHADWASFRAVVP